MNSLIQFLFLASTLSQSPADTTDRAFAEEVEAWHTRRISNLKRDYGWLTLVALIWLQEGENNLPSIGMISLNNGKVRFKAEASVSATVQGRDFSEGELKPGFDQDIVKIGSRAFIIIERDKRYAVRMWDTSSDVRKNFAGIDRYPVSPKWRINARWEPYNPPKSIKVPTVIEGYEEDYLVPGVAIFTHDGREYKLEPVLEEPNGDYFFIFADKTNGKETYAAGRFMYTKPAQDGKVVIDFNKSYNPPCAFTPYATCPLPPKQNRLNIGIEAGEKNYGEH